MLELGVCMDMSGGDSKFKSDPVCALRTMRKGVILQSNDVMWRQVTIGMHSLVEPGKYGLFSRFQTMHSAHPSRCVSTHLISGDTPDIEKKTVSGDLPSPRLHPSVLHTKERVQHDCLLPLCRKSWKGSS